MQKNVKISPDVSGPYFRINLIIEKKIPRCFQVLISELILLFLISDLISDNLPRYLLTRDLYYTHMKADSIVFFILKELAPDDTSIVRYERFEFVS